MGERYSGPRVSVSVVVGGPPASHRPPLSNYAQASLHVIEKIRNRIEVVAAGGEGPEYCKVNKNDCQKDGDHVNGVT